MIGKMPLPTVHVNSCVGRARLSSEDLTRPPWAWLTPISSHLEISRFPRLWTPLVRCQNSITWAPGEGNVCLPFPPVTCIVGQASVVHSCNRWKAIGKEGDSSSAIVLLKQHPDALCHIGFDGQMVMVQAGMDHLEAAGRRAA